MIFKQSKYPLHKLKVGTSFNLFNTKWVIKEVGEYDWRMDNNSVEYKIESSTKKAYLEVEYFKNKYEVIFSEDLNLTEEKMIEALVKEKVHINNDTFELEETYHGTYKNITFFLKSESLESYMFYNSKDEILTIERWNDGTYESFIGKEIKFKKIKIC